MSGSHITINANGGSFTGYLARPGVDGTGPGVVVLQEIFGVNTVMRGICDALARDGFVAFCPDLFWRLEPDIMLTDHTEAEWGRAVELMQAFDIDLGVEDIAVSIAALREHPACTGKVGAIGYCLGGLLAYLTATRTDADASIGYYGVNLPDRLAEAERIAAPMMLHIAGRDSYTPPEAQQKIIEQLQNHPMATLHSYPEMEHAFAREGGQHYDAAQAQTANERSVAFLRAHLA